MPVFTEIKNRVQTLKEKIKGHHKWKMFLYAGIIVFYFRYYLANAN